MMEFKPHAYQEYAIDYIKTHPVAAILLGCGLGKTSIALTAIDDMLHDSFDVRKVLVVAPIRVCTNSWPDEIRKWDHLSDIRWLQGGAPRRAEGRCRGLHHQPGEPALARGAERSSF